MLTDSEKINLLTISMGGPTARYVASVYPELASNGVYYYSMAGAESFTNFFDPTDYVFYALEKVFFKSGESSDGLISACSGHWGKVIRDDYPMNHLDTANHLFGLTKRGFDPVNLYVQQVNRLKNKGL